MGVWFPCRKALLDKLGAAAGAGVESEQGFAVDELLEPPSCSSTEGEFGDPRTLGPKC